jgi:Holliday junction resolvasome RuvABC endonuclease subunit
MTVTTTERPPARPRLANFAVKGYEPPVREYRFADLRVLALDQALAHTGLVEVSFHGPGFEVEEHRTITMDDDMAGNTAVLAAGRAYFGTMRQVLMDHVIMGVPQVVVYELPPNAFGMYRPESAMLAALCVGILCEQLNLEHHMVQAQATKTLWASNPKATKTQLKHALLEKWPFLKQAMAKATEHEWDALSMALTYAWENY